MIKVLINLSLALFVIGMAYGLFYFEVIPKLINHYRKFTTKRREYDKQIVDIQADDK